MRSKIKRWSEKREKKKETEKGKIKVKKNI